MKKLVNNGNLKYTLTVLLAILAIVVYAIRGTMAYDSLETDTILLSHEVQKKL